jgi:hypothetical protein
MIVSQHLWHGVTCTAVDLQQQQQQVDGCDSSSSRVAWLHQVSHLLQWCSSSSCCRHGTLHTVQNGSSTGRSSSSRAAAAMRQQQQ